tara:strand:+ start:78 stop:314 length:237 start_codon:yes stop_codon:yes gene_type:complete
MTKLFRISTPALAGILQKELVLLFPSKKIEILIVGDLSSCLMYDLSYEDLSLISKEVADCLIHELKFEIIKEIIINEK